MFSDWWANYSFIFIVTFDSIMISWKKLMSSFFPRMHNCIILMMRNWGSLVVGFVVIMTNSGTQFHLLDWNEQLLLGSEMKFYLVGDMTIYSVLNFTYSLVKQWFLVVSCSIVIHFLLVHFERKYRSFWPCQC